MDHQYALYLVPMMMAFYLLEINMIDVDDLFMKNGQCLVVMDAGVNETSWLWYYRPGYASINLTSKLIKRELIKDSPKLNFERISFYFIKWIELCITSPRFALLVNSSPSH